MSVHALMIQSDTLRPSHSAASITKLCANHLRVFPEGTNPAITTHPATEKTAMKIAKIILAGTTALTHHQFGGFCPTSAYGNSCPS
jgi:hypothetical protein